MESLFTYYPDCVWNWADTREKEEAIFLLKKIVKSKKESRVFSSLMKRFNYIERQVERKSGRRITYNFFSIMVFFPKTSEYYLKLLQKKINGEQLIEEFKNIGIPVEEIKIKKSLLEKINKIFKWRSR